MKDSIRSKLETLVERREEVEALISDAQIISDQDKFRTLSKEYSDLEDLTVTFKKYQSAEDDLEEAKLMMDEDDAEMREMAQEEFKASKAEIARLDQELQLLMLPKDPNDSNNCFLEIRAGAGGDEAAIFAGDLFRMYSRYIESKKWKLEVITSNESDQGGFKEVIAHITGNDVYGTMKFESGGHRVQRVPETESPLKLILPI